MDGLVEVGEVMCVAVCDRRCTRSATEVGEVVVRLVMSVVRRLVTVTSCCVTVANWVVV